MNIDKIKKELNEPIYNHIGTLNKEQLTKQKQQLENDFMKITTPEIWEITLLTPKGIVKEIYKPLNSKISDFEQEMVQKYGTFITQSSKLITN